MLPSGNKDFIIIIIIITDVNILVVIVYMSLVTLVSKRVKIESQFAGIVVNHTA